MTAAHCLDSLIDTNVTVDGVKVTHVYFPNELKADDHSYLRSPGFLEDIKQGGNSAEFISKYVGKDLAILVLSQSLRRPIAGLHQYKIRNPNEISLQISGYGANDADIVNNRGKIYRDMVNKDLLLFLLRKMTRMNMKSITIIFL